MKHFSLLLSILFLSVGLQAQNAGDFDPSFGNNGVVMTAIGTNFGMANDLVVQSDGKIILVGQSRSGSYRYTLARYNANGTLDTSFGTDGIVTTTIAQSSNGISAVLQTDGRIVVTGLTLSNSEYHGVVVRYNTDGSLDNSFGTAGITHLTIENTAAVVLQNDGKIVVGGFTADNFAMARLNADGSLDITYGSLGYVITQLKDPDGSNISSYILGLALQADGKILAAGFSYSYTTFQDVAVARFMPNGALDATFANAGIFTANLGGLADFSSSVTVQNDGKIVIGAHKELGILPGTPTYDAAIIRLNADGSYDATFGANGVAYFDFAEHATYVNDAVLQADGSIVFAGQVVNYAAGKWDTYVARATSNGALDLTFADNGVRLIDPFGTDDNASSLAIQDDGKILLSGYSTNPSGVYNFTVMRFLGDPVAGTPAVDVTFANVTPTTLDVTLTPNAQCASFYFVIMTPAELAQWLPMFGTEAALIKAFGIHAFETTTHHFTGLMPNTAYDVYSLSVGHDGVEAPFATDFVQTSTLGGNGVATATIVLSEVTQNSVRMVVTPNSETSVYHDGLITKAMFDEMGEAAVLEYFQNNGWPLYAVDDWVWIDLESNTVYKAVATAKNALGEWGTPTIVEFSTLVTSINDNETHPLVIFPNPSQGKFDISGENLQGSNIRIMDINGKEVYSNRNVNNLISVDLSLCSNGLYLIEIEKDGQRSTSKFMKQ